MRSVIEFYHTNKYRCLFYPQSQLNDLYIMSCGIEQCIPKKTVAFQDRKGYRLHLILSGEGILRVNGNEYKLSANQFFVTKPGESVWYQADENNPWKYCWLSFDGYMATGYCANCGLIDGVYHMRSTVSAERFKNIIEKLLDNPELTRANEILQLSSLLECLSMAMLSYYQLVTLSTHSDDMEKMSKHIEYDAGKYVQYTLDSIHGNYRTIKISDIAKNIGVTRSYLTNIFTKQVGVSPQEYLIQYRLDKSIELLENSDFSIQEIGFIVGYNDPLAFSKIFSKKIGCSPKNYRLQKEKS